MQLCNANVFVGHQFVPGSISFTDVFTQVGTVSETDGDVIDAHGAYIIPGLVDIHTHGAVGEDASDGNPDGLTMLSRYYARKGVTSWLPTTMTLKEPELSKAMCAIRDFSRPEDGARIAGVHLEGPFLSYAKRGAQAAENLHKPDIDMLNRLNALSGHQIKQVTIAPEEEGAMDFIRQTSAFCTVSVGHTCADYGTAMEAYRNGATHATHLYNGMPSLHHREPGVIGAALDAGATVELICDGLHIHPSVIRLTHRLFGEKLVLISDSLRCAGMPDGEYTLGGQPIEVKNGKATLKGTDTLAGSSIHLMDAVRNCVRFGLSLEDAVYAASTAPAKAIRMENTIGRIAEGNNADFVMLDQDLNVLAVYIGGKQVC